MLLLLLLINCPNTKTSGVSVSSRHQTCFNHSCGYLWTLVSKPRSFTFIHLAEALIQNRGLTLRLQRGTLERRVFIKVETNAGKEKYREGLRQEVISKDLGLQELFENREGTLVFWWFSVGHSTSMDQSGSSRA